MNDGFIPKKYRAIDAAVTVAINTGNRSAGENLFTNSSRTNSVPAIGALNVAAIPNSNPRGTRVNLLAPIILNTAQKTGGQIILSGSGYEVNFPLFKD